jgi:hypothetical protein
MDGGEPLDRLFRGAHIRRNLHFTPLLAPRTFTMKYRINACNNEKRNASHPAS